MKQSPKQINIAHMYIFSMSHIIMKQGLEQMAKCKIKTSRRHMEANHHHHL